ncbi:hypothetical protein PDIG_34620 [Penicillium digitatum PHI26]|uniref:Uncharacterized protein n=2 Tax=Penicillium digitatum TaxID=36651 RepID=K9FZR7_PEND2|nr:hypothetical protein PDIP_54190 [Penicillium digitatum Pd1]EKV11937.1 hypothetical protein PDIP_54190 [Penicillium digitatum Pd1]EKV14082.1 hypothetical protein PDIG_34620 [Penicillium digitatum PHI26]
MGLGDEERSKLHLEEMLDQFPKEFSNYLRKSSGGAEAQFEKGLVVEEDESLDSNDQDGFPFTGRAPSTERQLPWQSHRSEGSWYLCD